MAKNDKKTQVENINEEMEMDWDSGLGADTGSGEDFIPAIGEYDFEIVEFERTYSKSGKAMAKINLRLDCDGQFYRVYDYLVLQQNMAWKLATFFESLGLKKKGEELAKMPWDQIMHAHGRVKIKHEQYNGSQTVKIDRYIPSVASQAPSDPTEGSMPFEI